MSIEKFIGDMVFLHGVDKTLNQKSVNILNKKFEYIDNKFEILDEINLNNLEQMEILSEQVENLETEIEQLKGLFIYLAKYVGWEPDDDE